MYRRAFRRIVNAKARSMNEIVMKYGPVDLTLGSLWSLVPPDCLTQSDIKEITAKQPRFVPGWLHDRVMVCQINLKVF